MPDPGDTAVLTIDPRTDPRWAALVHRAPSDVFHAPAWIRAVADTYRFPVAARLLLGPSGPVAGFPFADVSGITGRRQATFPFSDYCDPLAADATQWGALTDGLGEPKPPMTIRCLHNTIPLGDPRFRETGRARWHGIDVTGEVWDRIHPAARRAIRRSRDAGVTIGEAGDVAELREFFELHLRIRKHKYRLLAQPFAFFENLWEQFGSSARLMLAKVDGSIAAGVLYLEWKETLYYKFNASDPAFAAARPNDALMWAGIEAARDGGLTRLDLGLSDWDQEGLIRYKRKYASEERAISFLSEDRARAAEGPLERLGVRMPDLTRLLTDRRLPDELTERAGAALYRYFA